MLPLGFRHHRPRSITLIRHFIVTSAQSLLNSSPNHTSLLNNPGLSRAVLMKAFLLSTIILITQSLNHALPSASGYFLFRFARCKWL
ncbi:AAEL008633-PA [Aedes aegypti]|uniref:AAEL008633-PA n=1 Tax=Aedes aegypti TaxID=7159 RepID=Q16Y86_AEDAE|nr:AAEL008633-PA [Aedes aegypti]